MACDNVMPLQRDGRVVYTTAPRGGRLIYAITARQSEQHRQVTTNDARKRLAAERGGDARGAVPSTQSRNAARPFSRTYFFGRSGRARGDANIHCVLTAQNEPWCL
ncbi:unnamed protein product, partial [Brenthis ino]